MVIWYIKKNDGWAKELQNGHHLRSGFLDAEFEMEV
jgi:hypothetical protein